MGCTNNKESSQPKKRRSEKYKDNNPPSEVIKNATSQEQQVKGPSRIIQKVPDKLVNRAPRDAQDIFLRPYILVEMAVKEEQKFIKLVKENNIKNLIAFIGYQYEPGLILKSGKKVNTMLWNALTFALVLGRESLFNFIMKDVNSNIQRLLTINLSGDQEFPELDEDDFFEEIVSLMVGNESHLLKTILNEYSYFIKSEDIKSILRIVQRSHNPVWGLEIILYSKIFRQFYYEKVVSLSQFKGSFEQFYSNHLDIFNRNQACSFLLQRVLVQHPYNAGFGFYLLQRYDKVKDSFSSIDQLLQKSSDLRDFDVYRLGKLSTQQLSEISKSKVITQSQSAASFWEAFKKSDSKYQQVDDKAKNLLTKALKGDASGVKSKIGHSDIPKEAVGLVSGLRFEQIKILAEQINEHAEFETQSLTCLEIACAHGHSKIVQYLVDELGLRSHQDFMLYKRATVVNQMPIVVGPILKKDKQSLAIILQQSHLWTYEDLLSILSLIKNTKWTEGMDIALNSSTAFELFSGRSLNEKFRFIRDLIILAFRIDVVKEEVEEPMQLHAGNPLRQRSLTTIKSKSILSQDEKVKLRKQIRERLTKQPYSCAYTLQEFAQRRDTYKFDSDEVIPEDRPEELVVYLRQGIDNSTELDLHDYIKETNGKIVNHLESYIQLYSKKDPTLQIQLVQSVQDMLSQIKRLIDTIMQHPTYLDLGNKDKNANLEEEWMGNQV